MGRSPHAVTKGLIATLVALTVLGVATAMSEAATASTTNAVPAASVPSATTAYFNDPSDPAHRDDIENELEALINGAPSGSRIRINFAEYHSQALTNALLAAKSRGVQVEVAADGYIDHPSSGTTDPTFTALKQGLGTTTGAPATSGVKSCYTTGKSSCNQISPYGIHHVKFALFSTTGGQSDVVFETSQNAATYDTTGSTPNSGVNAYNNAIVLVNQTAVYSGYNTRFDVYWTPSGNAQYTSATGTGAKGYFLPDTNSSRKSASDSPLLGVLDNMDSHHDCTAQNTTGGYGASHTTEIQVVQSQFNDANIAQMLLKLDGEGCVVRIARDLDYYQYRDPGTYATADAEYKCVDEILSNGGPQDGITQHLIDDGREYYHGSPSYDNLYDTPPQFDFVHSKYLVVSGSYNGQANTQDVWAGSYNYTYGALRENDETYLNVQDPAIVAAYQTNFEKLVALPNPPGFPAGATYDSRVQGGYTVHSEPDC